jgi:hypothetical protein
LATAEDNVFPELPEELDPPEDETAPWPSPVGSAAMLVVPEPLVGEATFEDTDVPADPETPPVEATGESVARTDEVPEVEAAV